MCSDTYDVIISELSKKYGYKRMEMVYRDISNKVMPTKNTPDNVSGNAGNTMNRESIMLMKY